MCIVSMRICIWGNKRGINIINQQLTIYLFYSAAAAHYMSISEKKLYSIYTRVFEIQNIKIINMYMYTIKNPHSNHFKLNKKMFIKYYTHAQHTHLYTL